MRRIIFIGLLACLPSLPARAEIECQTPMEAWQPVSRLREVTDKMGWTVLKIRADDGCYHVLATDRDGRVVKAVFDPQSLKLLGPSHDSDDEDHETTGGSADSAD